MIIERYCPKCGRVITRPIDFRYKRSFCDSTCRNSFCTSERNVRNWKKRSYRSMIKKVFSKSAKIRFKDPNERHHRSIVQTFISTDPKRIEEFSNFQKNIWKDPSYRRKMVRIHLKGYAEGRRNVRERLFEGFKCGWIITKKGGNVYYDSGWELAFIQIVESAKIVKSFKKNPFPIPYKYKGKKHSFYPDFFLELKDGRKFVIELKGKMENKRKIMAKFKAASKWCEVKGYEWCVIREKPFEPLTGYLQ